MTAFTTPCSKNGFDRRACRLMAALLFFTLSLFSLTSAAAGIEVKQAALSADEDVWQLDAEFDINIGHRLEEIVSHGVPLYFVLEFTLSKPRWYWVDEHIVSKQETWRLSYNALTRQYRLSTGALHQNFVSLEEALGVLARLRHWRVAEHGALKPGESYNAALRLKLDLTQLPKPFQVTAIGNKDWHVTAEVKRWNFTPPPPESMEKVEKTEK